MSSEAAQLDLLRGRSLALAVAGRGEEALPLIAEARKLHESLSADLRRPGLSLVLFAEVLTLGELGRMDAARNTAAKYRGNGIPAMRDWMLLAEARLDLSVGRPGDERQALITLVRTSRGSGSARPNAGHSPSSPAASCSKATARAHASTSIASPSSRSASAACSTPTSIVPTHGSPPSGRACQRRVRYAACRGR